jgi:hypothetical protein
LNPPNVVTPQENGQLTAVAECRARLNSEAN